MTTNKRSRPRAGTPGRHCRRTHGNKKSAALTLYHSQTETARLSYQARILQYEREKKLLQYLPPVEYEAAIQAVAARWEI